MARTGGQLLTITRQKFASKAAFSRVSSPTNLFIFIQSMIRQRRSILGPRDLNRDYRQELSPQLRTGIVAYKDAGLSAAEIARRTNLPSSTIKTTLERVPKRSNQQSKPRAGSPPILTPYARRLILRLVRAILKIKYSEICIQTRLEVSKSTFYRLLKKEGTKN